MNMQKSLEQELADVYRNFVNAAHPKMVHTWPVISGYNLKVAGYKGWTIVVFKHTGVSGMISSQGLGEVDSTFIGADHIDQSNMNSIRSNLTKRFQLTPFDAIFFVPEGGGNLSDQFLYALQQHEFALGMVPMKIFLSHKGADKPLVREFKQSLELLGFDPWLDEDAMHAGHELERSILKGFSDSCAAIFFVTPNYKDENYLATEVDYAIAEKRKKGDKFSIITLVFSNDEGKASVPDLLHKYVWKEPNSQLSALAEIIKALPVKVGQVYWK